jgi:hypothetical protein
LLEPQYGTPQGRKCDCPSSVINILSHPFFQ